MSEKNELRVTRRDLGRLGAGFVLAGAGVALFGRNAYAAEQKVGEIADYAGLITAIQYVEKSTTAGQKCSGCMLYTAGEGGRGKCTLFTQGGTVSAEGHCSSWTAMPA